MIDFLREILGFATFPDRLTLAAAALLLTAFVGAVTGPLRGNANPLYWGLVDTIFGGLGTRLDRRQRTPRDLMLRGSALSVVALVISFLAGVLAVQVVGAAPLYGFTEIVFLSLILTSGAVWFSLLRLYFALKESKIGKGVYYAIARSSRMDLSGIDDFGITRTGMALAARVFDKGLVAPVLWYLLLGLPGAYFYAAAAALTWRFGKDGFTKGFGWLALFLEKILGFFPMVLSGILMALAGLFTPTGGMTRALAGLMGGKGRAPYVEGGSPVTAMAWSLNVALGGPSTDMEGSTIKRAWVGPEGATAQLQSGHLRRALYMSLMAHLLFLTVILALILL